MKTLFSTLSFFLGDTLYLIRDGSSKHTQPTQFRKFAQSYKDITFSVFLDFYPLSSDIPEFFVLINN